LEKSISFLSRLASNFSSHLLLGARDILALAYVGFRLPGKQTEANSLSNPNFSHWMRGHT
jgi:hypothetical protein